ncbi:MAG: hypothetical protein HYY37_04500 [Candidatus Aenigmarchaeota archaeon]|nr:hypothetical protein [Candidatus Aenigmarchaeota archaeon]
MTKTGRSTPGTLDTIPKPEISQRALRSYLGDKTMESWELYGLPSRSRGVNRTGVFFGGRDFMTNQPTFFSNVPGEPYPIPSVYKTGMSTITSSVEEETGDGPEIDVVYTLRLLE